MLGDGCLSKAGNSYRYSHGQAEKNKEWLYYINNTFLNEGIESTISLHRKSRKGKFGDRLINNSDSYQVRSHTCQFFNNQHNRWYSKWYDVDEYPKRVWHLDEDREWFIWKKIVPKDIKLNPECVSNWYMGDGSISLYNKRESSWRITLATNGFEEKYVDYLLFLINDYIIEYPDASKNKSGKGYIIHIGKKRSINSFLGYIKPHVAPCFDYKIPEVN